MYIQVFFDAKIIGELWPFLHNLKFLNIWIIRGGFNDKNVNFNWKSEANTYFNIRGIEQAFAFVCSNLELYWEKEISQIKPLSSVNQLFEIISNSRLNSHI